MKLKEKRVSTELLHKGKFIALHRDSVKLPDGQLATREYIKHPDAVAVLPMFTNGDVLLVKQWRHSIQAITYEVPAGKMHDKTESPLMRVKAELMEETGYTPTRIRKLTSIWPSPGFSNELIHLYHATIPERHAKQTLDEGEFINLTRMYIDDALNMIESGKIRDSKTVVTLLHATSFLI